MTNEVMQPANNETVTQGTEGIVVWMRLFFGYFDENTVKCIIIVLFLSKGASQTSALYTSINAKSGDV